LGIEDETASAAEKIEEASFEDLLHLAKDEIMMEEPESKKNSPKNNITEKSKGA
jgi:hypothetical protein